MAAHVLVVAFLWVMLAVVIGVHAMDRGRSGFFWGLATILTGIVGVIAYLVVLGNELDDPDRGEPVTVCPTCEARYVDSPNYCGECGETLESVAETPTASIVRSGDRAYCGHCSERVDFDADECPSCGRPF